MKYTEEQLEAAMKELAEVGYWGCHSDTQKILDWFDGDA
jgi:hypothetical protein